MKFHFQGSDRKNEVWSETSGCQSANFYNGVQVSMTPTELARKRIHYETLFQETLKRAQQESQSSKCCERQGTNKVSILTLREMIIYRRRNDRVPCRPEAPT